MGVLIHAVCTGSPEAPTGGSFTCGSSSVAGTVCNGTCSTGGGPITAECQATGNWTVQGTCAQLQTGECIVGAPCGSVSACMLLGIMMVWCLLACLGLHACTPGLMFVVF
jgi:hypothetical protein